MTRETTFHFPAGTVEFLRGLAKHNRRDWFEDHRGDYETQFKAPAEVFCELVGAALQETTGLAYAARVYRIHRDVRFSKDKSPYNAHLHIGFTPQAGPSARPAWFFGIETGRMAVGTGLFGFDGPALVHYRERVAGPDGQALEDAMAAIRTAGFDPREPDLKRVPSSYAADHPRGDLLRRKSVSCWKDFPPETACRPDLVATVMGAFEGCRPVFDWLMDGHEPDED